MPGGVEGGSQAAVLRRAAPAKHSRSFSSLRAFFVKQRFRATLPGAILSVSCWIGLSFLLGIYFRTFANFNKTYGTLGAGIALMVWLYWTGFAMLVGAELNAELAKNTPEGSIEPKDESGGKSARTAA